MIAWFIKFLRGTPKSAEHNVWDCPLCMNGETYNCKDYQIAYGKVNK